MISQRTIGGILAGVTALTLGMAAQQPRQAVSNQRQGFPAPKTPQAVQQKNIRLLAHSNLNGFGDAGEGMIIQRLSDGTRLMYVAHGGSKICFSVLDVTKPDRPVFLTQIVSPAPGVTRCNSIALSGNLMAVANQGSQSPGKKTSAGMWLLDVSNPGRVKTAKTLDDLKVSFFDTSGPHSPGVHDVWFVDGEFVHMSSGAADFTPTHRSDDQMYMVVDVRDPKNPREVGRWWLPGTRVGDPCLPGCLPVRQQIDNGFRLHSALVRLDRPDRAYLTYVDAGALILDISGLADVKSGRARTFSPKLISRLDYSPPFGGYTHRFIPYPPRPLAMVADAALEGNCRDAPKEVWIVDISTETNPVIVGMLPVPDNVKELCERGRYGPHDLHGNLPLATSANLKNTVVSVLFGGGLRIYRMVDVPYRGHPPTIEEIGYYIPDAPVGQEVLFNDVLVDENHVMYVSDRERGLYILSYTGSEPLD